MSSQHYTSKDDPAQSSREAQRADFDEYLSIIKTLFENSPLMIGVAELSGDNIIGVVGNSAVAQLLSLSPDDVSERTGEELGNPPEENQIWLEHYRRSQQEGKQVKFEYERPHRNPRQWLSATVNFLGMGSQNRPRFSFYVEDITERKQAEARLNDALERDAYLVKLSDALRPLADPLEIQAAATQVLGEHLGVTRAVYIEIDGDEYVIARDYVNSVPSMAGQYPVSSFGPGKLADYRAGKTRVVRDTRDDIHNSPSDNANFSAINVSAGIGVPLVKDGAFVANLVVHMNEPRNWTPEEVALVEATAERTWAAVERVRAEAILRESEERFRTSIESLAEAFVIYSAVRKDGKIVDLRYEYVNDMACLFHQLPREKMVGHTILEIAPAVKDTGLFDQYVQVIETGQALSGQRFVPNKDGGKTKVEGIYNIRVSKFRDGMIITANDVTEQVRLETEHQKATQEREIHHRLTEQREMERQSIARDIHDGPVQTLSSLLFNLQLLQEASADPAFQLEVNQVKLSIKSTVQELRQIMYELRPPSVIQFGISKAIRAYTENLREHHSRITWNLDLADDDQLLSQQTCLTLFRIYQEAVNNIIRHAEARQAWVRTDVLTDQIVLEIRDDGKGFVRKQDMAHLTERKHFGLAGMAERVEAIHGTWEIKTRPGDGTIITVKIPVIRE